MAVYTASNDNFHDLIREGTSLVFFQMENCEGCHDLMPTMLRIETQMPFVKLIHVDINVCDQIAKEYNVYATPTIYLAQNGDMAEYQGNRRISDIRCELGKLLYGGT